MPDELVARLDALGPRRANYAFGELLAYYQIQSEDRRKREWEAAIEQWRDKVNRGG